MRPKLVIFVILLVTVLFFSPVHGVYSAIVPAYDSLGNSVLPLPGYVLDGQASPNLAVLVNIAIPLKNIDLLCSTLKQVSDPSSPLFRHFLTPSQVGQNFLPKVEYESMLAYLESIGLPVVMDSLDSMIVVKANAAQVRQYFGAEVNIYSNGTDSYYMTSGNSLLNGAHFVASNATALTVKPQFANLLTNKPDGNVTFTEGGIPAKDLQTVYNATSLYAQGFQGEGQTIGMLDFYGSPTIEQDLSLFDERFGFPDPTFNIIPLAPYNPNLGVSLSWSGEVSLDVELAHAMAPKAAIDLYVTNGALSFAADLAPIISYAQDNTLSMSFSFAPEWAYPLSGGEMYYFNMLLPDEYFMIGSLEGITFMAGSGDAGGSGYSSGPGGNSAYPSDSPYVTSTGGTQTYLFTQQNGSKTFVQTGWSNPGYVPNGVNAGGSGGGVSFLEPKPWYQNSQQTPPSYPNGRMEPDLSLQAGADPGVFIVNQGATVVAGGTSASVQLLSGLFTLIAQSSGGSLGLVNPFLYAIGNDASLYTKAYVPITFGYNIPWTASFGYNLVAGWGAPNIGQIAQLYNAQFSKQSLSIFVTVTDVNGASPFEFTANQTMNVMVDIYNGFTPVTSGQFTAKLVTLAGTFLVTPLTFNSISGVWTCALKMGQQSGVAYLAVNGTSAGLSGEDFTEIFAGYVGIFYSPSPTNPWTTAGNGLQVVAASTDLEGNSAPAGSLTMQVSSYSILSNSFSTIDTVDLTPTNISGLVNVTGTNLTKAYPAGPLTLILQGSTYGFLPFTNGIYLQNSLIFPEVAVAPGSIAPGQYLTIITTPIAPLNIADTSSIDTGKSIGSDVTTGSSVTVFLVNPAGTTVARSDLVYQSLAISGLIQVPANSASGLYTILLRASYSSLTLGSTLYGSFYGKVWVSNGTITPLISLSPQTLYMGQVAQVSVDIRYPNNQEVTQGEYTTLIYPQQQQGQFLQIMFTKYQNFELTPLTYNPNSNRWEANINLPSPYNIGNASPENGYSFNQAGPYEVYVTGLSYDGVPTTTSFSAQQSFFIQPYVYLINQVISKFQQNSGLALSGVTINGSVNLTDDIFLQSNYIQSGTTALSDSTINGTLFVDGSNLTLQDIHGGNLVATNSSIILVNSNLSSVTLINSRISLSSASYDSIIPTPPVIQISSPSNGGSYKGEIAVSVNVTANDINSVKAYLNGQLIQSFSNNGTLNFTLPSATYPDGTYSLQLVASQTDGINSSAAITIYFTNQQDSLLSSLNSLGNTINNLISSQSSLQNQLDNLKSSQSSQQNQLSALRNDLNTLNSSQSTLIKGLNSSQSAMQNQLNDLNNSSDTLNGQIATLKDHINTFEYMAYSGIGIGVAALIFAVAVAFRRRSKISPPPTI
jgi:subtilase family serine protease